MGRLVADFELALEIFNAWMFALQTCSFEMKIAFGKLRFALCLRVHTAGKSPLKL